MASTKEYLDFVQQHSEEDFVLWNGNRALGTRINTGFLAMV